MSGFRAVRVLALMAVVFPAAADKYDDAVAKAQEDTLKQQVQQAGIDELVQRAEQGSVHALNKLGYNYYYGKFAPQDYAEAFRWFTRSAAANSDYGQYYLGWMYSKGQGTTQNPVKAHEWFMRAAKQGHLDAQIQLGHQYEVGQGVGKNRNQAIRWYTLAAERGNGYAQHRLGMMYFNCDVPKNFSRSYGGDSIGFGINMEEKTAEQRKAEEEAIRPNEYLPVRGPNWDYQKAYVWFTIAANNGIAEAGDNMVSVAIMIEPKYVEAAKLQVIEQQKIIQQKQLQEPLK